VLKIKNITIKVKNAVSNISITVKEGALPSGAKPVIEAGKGAVLKFLEITKSNLQDLDIDIVMINFEVDKNWTSTNKVDPSKIYLYRYYNNSWSKLKTEKSGEDSNNYYYESKSPGLSVFAIAGEKSGLFGFIDISGWAIYIIIIIAVAIVVILAYMLWPTDKIKLAYSQKSEKKELKPEMVTKPIIKSAQSIQSESSIRHIKERFKNIIPRLRKEKEVYKGS